MIVPIIIIALDKHQLHYFISIHWLLFPPPSFSINKSVISNHANKERKEHERVPKYTAYVKMGVLIK